MAIQNQKIQYHTLETHLLSLEEQVGFHFADNNSIAHAHNGFAEFSLIVSGEWEHIYDEHTEILNKDTLIFLGVDTVHTLTPKIKGCYHFTFFFKDEYFRKFLMDFFPKNTSILETKYKKAILAPSISNLLLYEAQKMCGSRKSSNHQIEFQNYMHNLIYFMFFNNDVHLETSEINKYGCALRKFFDSYMLLTDSLQSVYRMFPICPATLIKQFENETGQTIAQYRNDKRMEYASFLLMDRRLTVINVANKVGISSPSHFAAEFKKKFGISPKDYAIKQEQYRQFTSI